MSIEEEVLAAAAARSAALVAGDAEQLKRLHHPSLRWTTHRGEVRDRAAYLAGNEPGTLRWLDQKLSGVDVVVAGTVAVLTAEVTDVVSRDGQPRTFRMRLTLTWVAGPDGWQCLAGHAGPQLD
ncbi:nuclear transport factor 2 family protein [Actinoplanes sp. NPDC020271]|uniref:nuclear transport factor 2 family protein n=1 Tax=Actinoplanes sp. NPDC020271 TaxID=3363896 RepID=UPI0037942CE6